MDEGLEVRELVREADGPEAHGVLPALGVPLLHEVAEVEVERPAVEGHGLRVLLEDVDPVPALDGEELAQGQQQRREALELPAAAGLLQASHCRGAALALHPDGDRDGRAGALALELQHGPALDVVLWVAVHALLGPVLDAARLRVHLLAAARVDGLGELLQQLLALLPAVGGDAPHSSVRLRGRRRVLASSRPWSTLRRSAGGTAFWPGEVSLPRRRRVGAVRQGELVRASARPALSLPGLVPAALRILGRLRLICRVDACVASLQMGRWRLAALQLPLCIHVFWSVRRLGRGRWCSTSLLGDQPLALGGGEKPNWLPSRRLLYGGVLLLLGSVAEAN
mmetsp:Transcript_54004/g.157660  ORF Transcript_54004/g.157660 Transcript_54004/m.157660 type:complete len:339 (+) Transcript_54004:309-1325(+)